MNMAHWPLCLWSCDWEFCFRSLPEALYLVPWTWCLGPGSLGLVPCVCCLVSVALWLLPCVCCLQSGTLGLVPTVRCLGPLTWDLGPGAWYLGPGSMAPGPYARGPVPEILWTGDFFPVPWALLDMRLGPEPVTYLLFYRILESEALDLCHCTMEKRSEWDRPQQKCNVSHILFI